MSTNKPLSTNMRVLHRYLGYFLAGIMAVYALSGILMIFRDTDFLKKEKLMTRQIQPNAEDKDLPELLKMRQLKVKKTEGSLVYFDNGTYDRNTGKAEITIKELPWFFNKLTQIHKARSGDSLFFLNVFFGVSLLFFVVSSFYMFLPKTSIFRKGLYFTLAGIVLTIILVLI